MLSIWRFEMLCDYRLVLNILNSETGSTKAMYTVPFQVYVLVVPKVLGSQRNSLSHAWLLQARVGRSVTFSKL